MVIQRNIDALARDYSISTDNALDIRQSCTKPSIYGVPQGKILRPLLVVIYLDYTIKYVGNAKVRPLIVDDTAIFIHQGSQCTLLFKSNEIFSSTAYLTYRSSLFLDIYQVFCDDIVKFHLLMIIRRA